MRPASKFFSEEFENLFHTFLASLSHSRTAAEYWGYTCLLCDYLEKDFLDIDESDARRYIDSLYVRYQQGQLSRKTINVRLSSYKSVAGFLETYYNDCYINPFANIPLVPVDLNVTIGHVPSMVEMDAIMSCAKNYGSMYYLILALASRCGLSLTEIVGLTVQNILETSSGTLTIVMEKKKGATRYVPLPVDVSGIMKEYMSSFPTSGALFINQHGNPITRKNIESAVNKIIEASGIERHFTMRDFRTRAIVDMKKCGVDSTSLSEYAGISEAHIYRFNKVVEQVGECPADLVNYQLNKLEGGN